MGNLRQKYTDKEWDELEEMSKKEGEKFYSTPEGKILLHMCHDHAHGGSIIMAQLKLIEKYILPKLESEDKIFLKEKLDKARKGYSDCKNMVDYGYSEIKKLKGF